MKKILNKRLQTLSAFIEEDEIVLDIGCDHGLLGIYLTLNRHHIKMVSSDINVKPLLKAKENIHRFNLDNRIETRLGNGLEVMSDDITTVVISGMGAENIINILKDINNYPAVTKLVLSPNNDFPLLRKRMWELGFSINEERIVLEKRKYYLISKFVKGKSGKMDFYFGKLDLASKNVRGYYQYIYNNNKAIFKKLSIRNKIKKLSLLKENRQINKKINHN